MGIRKDIRENPTDQIMWGYYSYGRLIGVASRRYHAKADAERWTGKPWSEINYYIELHKVVVKKYKNEQLPCPNMRVWPLKV